VKIGFVIFGMALTELLYSVHLFQVASIQCSKLLKEMGKEMTFINGCACSLKVDCSEHLDLLKQQVLNGEDAEFEDQCPVQPENLSWEDCLSMLQEKSIATASLSEILFQSVNNPNFLEVCLLQIATNYV